MNIWSKRNIFGRGGDLIVPGGTQILLDVWGQVLMGGRAPSWGMVPLSPAFPTRNTKFVPRPRIFQFWYLLLSTNKYWIVINK